MREQPAQVMALRWLASRPLSGRPGLEPSAVGSGAPKEEVQKAERRRRGTCRRRLADARANRAHGPSLMRQPQTPTSHGPDLMRQAVMSRAGAGVWAVGFNAT